MAGTVRSVGAESRGAQPAEGQEPADHAQFEELYRTYRAALVRYARSRKASDPELIADQALLDGYWALPRLNNTSPPVVRSYLFTAARSYLAREFGRRDQPTILSDDLMGPGTGFEQQVVQRMEVTELLEELPVDQRNVLQLRFIENLTPDETAARLGKTSNAVRQLQFRGVRRLRRAMFGVAVVLILLVAGVVALFMAATGEPLDTTPVDSVEEQPPSPDPDQLGLGQLEADGGRSIGDLAEPLVIIPRPGNATSTTIATPTTTVPPSTTTSPPTTAAPTPTTEAPAPSTTATTVAEPPPPTAPAGPRAADSFNLGLANGARLIDPLTTPAVGFARDSAWRLTGGSAALNYDAAGLSYTDGNGASLASNRGAVRLSEVQGRPSFSRMLAGSGAPAQTYWIGFLLRSNGGGDVDAFWSPDGEYHLGAVGVIEGSATVGFVGGPSGGIGLTPGSTRLIVAEIGLDGAALWVDPDLAEPGRPTAVLDRAPDTPAGALTFVFADPSGEASFTIDEVRRGQTFQDVAPAG
ncbi:MAG: sigma-70 family RNA polymerase sigma factor [Actinomycetota bacterium]